MNIEEKWFSDKSIQEQTSALIQDGQGNRTVGISIMVLGVEVLLEYDELKAAINSLDKDLEFHHSCGHIASDKKG